MSVLLNILLERSLKENWRVNKMNNEDLKLYELIRLAKKNNIKAAFEIILMFEKYIDKNSFINGKFNQECKDYIIDKLLEEIKKI